MPQAESRERCSPVSCVYEAEVRLSADDDVVEDADPDDLASLAEAAGQLEIFGARGGIAARMVVDQPE